MEESLSVVLVAITSVDDFEDSLSVTVIVTVGIDDFYRNSVSTIPARYFKVPDPDYNGLLQHTFDSYLPPIAPLPDGIMFPIRLILNRSREQVAVICLNLSRFGTESTVIKIARIRSDEGPLREAVKTLAGTSRRYAAMLPGAASVLFIENEIIPSILHLDVELEIPLTLTEENCV